MNTEKLLSDLEDIVNRGLEDVSIPYTKGNSIRIKHMIIRTSPNGYLIYDAKENRQIVRSRFKTTAVAIAKNLAQGNDITSMLIELDNLMLKHYNDAVFYKHAIKTSKDQFRKDVTLTRLDFAIYESKRVRNLLDRYIFSS
jgi:hypothetical protein